MTNSDRDPSGAGGRPPRPPLSRAAILSAALELVAADGFDALTMRGVANVLGVGAMSLYRYFRGREEIVDALLDDLLGTIPLALDDTAGWQEQLRHLARAHRELLHRVPSAIPALLATPRSGPQAARFGETVLGVLRRAGLTDEAAVGGFYTLIALNYGFISFEARRRRPDLSREQQEEQVRRTRVELALLPEQTFPLTVALAQPLAQFGTSDAQYRFALDTVVAGLAFQASQPERGASQRSGDVV